MENISPHEYQGDVQVWDIVTNGGETVFAATGKGLSVYDGGRWCNYPAPVIFRCLDFDTAANRVYAGADNEFGYWERDRYGQYGYIRLYANKSAGIPEIFWRVYAAPDAVYFQTHSSVYKYDKLTQQVAVLLSGKELEYMHPVDGELFLQAGDRLLRLEKENWIDQGVSLPGRIIDIYRQQNRLLFVSKDHGLFYVENGKLHPINSPANRTLAEARLFSSARLNDSTLLAGSILDGLYTIDGTYCITGHTGFDQHLNHTTVLSIHTAASSDIWLGIDGGMARIRQQPSEIAWHSRNRDIGSVYDAVLFKNKLYVATNKGLYSWDTDNRIDFIDGTQGQVWSLHSTDDLLVICHDASLLAFDGYRSSPCNRNGAWTLKPLDKTRYLSLDINGGFSVYEKTGTNFVFIKKITGFDGVHTDAGIDRFGQLWVQDRQSRPIRIKLDMNYSIEKMEKYELPAGTSALTRIVLDNDVCFFDRRTVYTYDIGQNKLVRNAYYSCLLEHTLFDPVSITQNGDHFFYSDRNKTAYLQRNGDSFFNHGEIFQLTGGYPVPAFARRLIPLDPYTTAQGLQNGIAFYSVKNQHATDKEEKQPTITQIVLENQGKETFLPVEGEEILSLPSGYSGLRLFFSGLYAHRQVRYAIDDHDWILAKCNPSLHLPPLDAGVHSVRIQNMEAGHKPGRIVTLQLRVATPWFRSYPFYTAIALFLLTGSWSIRTVFRYRMKAQQDILLKRQRRVLEQEKKEYELKLLKVQLKEEEKQLVNLTMEGIRRNAMLSEIRKDVVGISPEQGESSTRNRLRQIVKKIDYYLNNNEAQGLFEKYFNEIYDGFFDRLMQRHSGVTPNEMKLCAYIKLGLNTKEIAAYMNISPSSVEIARHRLRKKFELAQETNLQKYISEI